MDSDKKHATSENETKTASAVNSQKEPKSPESVNKLSTPSTPAQNTTNLKSNNGPFLILVLIVALLGGWGGSYIQSQSSNTVDTVKQKEIILQNDNIISDIAKRVGPSVVSIVTKQTQQGVFGDTREAEGAGTGVILTKDGLVLTNRHVVPSGVSSVSVVLSDGTKLDAKVLARDSLNDIAFLKLKSAKDLKVAELGDSSQMKVGDSVIAIGNALGQFQNTVTTGIISGIGRPITAQSEDGAGVENLRGLFQTDAAINPGNSGGPLVDMNGRVIGINTAVAGNAQNIGFSIPINDVKASIDSVQEHGKIIRPYIGVMYLPLTPDIAKQLDLSVSEGAFVGDGTNRQAVMSGSPADKAGIKNGDVILKVAGETVNEKNSLSSLIAKHKVGDTVDLTVLRANKEITLKIKLVAAPDNLSQQ